jgi:hypothetical protein
MKSLKLVLLFICVIGITNPVKANKNPIHPHGCPKGWVPQKLTPGHCPTCCPVNYIYDGNTDECIGCATSKDCQSGQKCVGNQCQPS